MLALGEALTKLAKDGSRKARLAQPRDFARVLRHSPGPERTAQRSRPTGRKNRSRGRARSRPEAQARNAVRCYDRPMTREEILAFAKREWAAVADAKVQYWAERKRSMAAADALAVGEMLRQHARQVKPGWPDQDERTADLAAHAHLSEALRAVSIHCTR